MVAKTKYVFENANSLREVFGIICTGLGFSQSERVERGKLLRHPGQRFDKPKGTHRKCTFPSTNSYINVSGLAGGCG